MKDVKKLFTCKCDIYVLENIENKETGRVESKEKSLFNNLPCFFINLGNNNYVAKGTVPTLKASGIVGVDKNVQVPNGCKIVVTKYGNTTEYAFSGVSAVYSDHKEIPVALFERWI